MFGLKKPRMNCLVVSSHEMAKDLVLRLKLNLRGIVTFIIIRFP